MWSTDPGAQSDPASTLDESLPHSHSKDIPWAMGDSEVPRSTRPRNVGHQRRHGAARGRPRGAAPPDHRCASTRRQGVYSAIGYSFHDPSREKTVHVDQYGGDVVSTYGSTTTQCSPRSSPRESGSMRDGASGWWLLGRRHLVRSSSSSCASRDRSCGGVADRPRPGDVGAPRGRLPVRSTPLLASAVVVGRVPAPVRRVADAGAGARSGAAQTSPQVPDGGSTSSEHAGRGSQSGRDRVDGETGEAADDRAVDADELQVAPDMELDASAVSLPSQRFTVAEMIVASSRP